MYELRIGNNLTVYNHYLVYTINKVDIFFKSLNFSVQSVHEYDQTQHTTSLQVLSMNCKALFDVSYTAQTLSVEVAGTTYMDARNINQEANKHVN